RDSLVENVRRVVTRSSVIDDDLFEQLEETLIEADVGVETTMTIVADLRKRAREERVSTPDELLGLLKQELTNLVQPGDHELSFDAATPPHVTLIAGVNGSG